MKELKLDAYPRYIGMINIFRSIGCIGDSLSSGEFEYDNNGEKGYWDYYDYSWGKQIERVTGVQITNFSRGGMTARQLYKEAATQSGPTDSINALFDKNNLKQAYIIALGVNDKSRLQDVYDGKAGCAATDINQQDYEQNAPTYVGYYAKIIQRIQKIQPDTKFFLVTMPSAQGNKEYTQLIYDIANCLDNCYVIDLYQHAPAYDEAFRDIYFCGGHMNTMGYVLSAQYIMAYIDWIIQNNPMDFKYVQFIGSQYKAMKE